MAEYIPEKTVTLEKMDYKYIDKCDNEKELERILRALRSGRDGYYPHLIEHCEKKLMEINPHNRSLRKPQPLLGSRDLKQEELSEINDGLRDWEQEMSKMNKDDVLHPQLNGNIEESDNLPPVRSAHTLRGKTKEAVNVNQEKPKRIKSYDYKSWDKFDADKECEKLEETMDEAKKGVKNTQVKIPDKINTAGLTSEEKQIRAAAEKDKGNEAFKAGDFEEALSYYSRSISLVPTAASFNNRALVYLRLEKWKEAKKDCNRVLSSNGEEHNLKAKLRKATALKALGEFNDAVAELEFVLEKEPNNARAKTILKEVEKLRKNKKPKEEEPSENTREEKKNPMLKPGKTMVITEVDGDSSEEEEDTGGSRDEKFQEIKDVKVTEEKQKDASKAKDVQYPVENKPVQLSQEPLKDPVHQENETEYPIKIPPTEPKFPDKADKLKSEAAKYFKTGRYDEAGTSYTKAIQSMSRFLKMTPIDPAHQLAVAVLHNNRAVCWLKQGNDKACIDDCTAVLDQKPWDVKALMRRGMAYQHMEKYALSYSDFKAAESVDWNNQFAQDGANRAASHLRQIHGMKWREKIPPVPLYSQRFNPGKISTTHKPTEPKAEKMKNSESTFKHKSNKQNATDVKPVTKPDTVVKRDVKGENSTVTEEPSITTTNKEGVASKPPTKNTKRKRNHGKSKKSPKEKKNEAKIKEDEEIKAKKDKIRKDLFEKLKGEGNEHVKKGDFTSAVDSYTRCISLCPKEPAGYTNRALCFLKLKKNISAANDCTKAIELDPINEKAYYRRSQARKAEGLYRDAETDIKKLLDIKPANEVAKAELTAIAKLISKNAWGQKVEKTSAAVTGDKPVSSNVPTKPKKRMVIEEVSSSSSDEGEFILPNDNDESVNLNAGSPLKPNPAEDHSCASTNSLKGGNEPISAVGQDGSENPVGDSAKASGDSKSPVNSDQPTKPSSPEPDVGQSSPKKMLSKDKQLTPFEFGSLWNSISDKSDIGSYKEILDTVAPNRLPELLSNKIDDHVICVIAKVALLHLTEDGNSERSYDMMYHLSRSERFAMAAMFLSDPDQVTLCSTFDELEAKKGRACTAKELRNLMKAYNL